MSITVKTGCGLTSGSLEYYAEAEPRLLKIREAFLSGKRDEGEVHKAVCKIAGRNLWEKDWREVTKDCKVFSEREAKWKAHEEANPVRCRLYGHEDVIAEFVMAKEAE